MKTAALILCISFFLFHDLFAQTSMFYLCNSSRNSSWREESIRSENPLVLFAGLGVVNGLHIGSRYRYLPGRLIEFSIGSTILDIFTREKTIVFALGHNWYFKPDQTATPFVGVFGSLGTRKTTTDEPLGNIYFLSGTIGLDAFWQNGININARIGPLIGKASPGVTKMSIDFGLGIGWALGS